MVEQYDDWGDPIRRYEPPDRSFQGIIRSYYNLVTRKYRTVSTIILIMFCFIWYWNVPAEPRVQRTDWSRFAYVQYVTDGPNLCNAYMVLEALHRHGSKAERVLMYPEEWDLTEHDDQDRVSQLLNRVQKIYKVVLKPVSIIDTQGKTTAGNDDVPSSWATSITKLRAFELGEYDRVLHLDSDITLLQNLDELFLLPSAPIAMPRAYWMDDSPSKWPLTSLLMLIEPNIAEFQNFMDILQSWKLQPGFQAGRNFDMDLLNHRFGSSAMVLPHRPYAMLTSEFRKKDHSAYMGNINGPRNRQARYTWDAARELKHAKLVHFSDWPLPKPWVMWPQEGLAAIQPTCADQSSTCNERTLWKDLYMDFRKRRKELCRILSIPAPKWDDLKNKTQGE